MTLLKTEGFDKVVADIVSEARLAVSAAEAVQVALTLGGRFAGEHGLAALTSADRVIAESVLRSDAGLSDGPADRLFLTATGRLAFRLGDEPTPPAAHLLGGLKWGDDQEWADVKSRARRARREAETMLRGVHSDLASEPAAAVSNRLDRIEYSLTHMAPVLIYVDERVYSNLGRFSNLPGKSLSAGDQRSVLTQLRGKPAADWDPADACFVACLDVLLSSGPPVRAEEFNGVQLIPATLARFLAGRCADYGAGPRAVAGALSLAALAALARDCKRLRDAALASRLPYRVINGLTLHKREHLMSRPTVLGDVPPPIATQVAGMLGAGVAAGTPIAALAPLWDSLAGQLARAPAPPRFSTAFEAALHALLSTVVEAFAADVSMSRGPRRFEPLRASPPAQASPLCLGTGDFYCCVTPSRAFAARFGGDRQGLVRTLAAYSARMRFNTWHYLPGTLGITDGSREDWFFAPTMPDITDWSDQHHTGHVAFGVRYAIRIPFGIDFDGRSLPGLYDVRLMRTGTSPFTTPDLRQAIAVGLLLQQLYQAMSAYEPRVTDFGKPWYETFHG